MRLSCRAMRTPYPATEPFATHQLPVSDLHTLYVEECGTTSGPPILFLHGGPGGGSAPQHRGFFHPDWHAVLFDQRGCGRSTPIAELTDNTTWDLVRDIERIREHLGINKWTVFGGSWGSTLALCYAITHPERVESLLLRGIFLCRPSELDFFYQEGTSWLFPDYYEQYIAVIPEAERQDLRTAFRKQLTSEDPSVRLAAARAWSQFEAATSRLLVDTASVGLFEEPDRALALARIENHFFMHNCWFPTDNYLLEQVPIIWHLPCTIVQGRYDVVCPMKSAWELHQAWPGSQLIVVPDAGHAVFEPGILHHLLEATDATLARLRS